MKLRIHFTFSILALMSCKNQTNTHAKHINKIVVAEAVNNSIKDISDTTYIDKKGNSHKYLGIIPDEARTIFI